jgi:pimeloyl-ACP methyl ester carboxylesterase
MEPLKAEELDEKYVVVNGLKIRYIVRGSGSPVILVHGIGEFLEVWWQNIKPLSEHYRVYAMDLVGHGLSDKPAVDYSLAFATEVASGFAQALGIERASLIGHSIGGVIAMTMAINFPEEVDKLVLVDSGGLTDEVSLLYRLCCLPLLGELLVMPTVKAGLRHGMKRAFYNPDRVTDEMVDKDYQFLKMAGAKRAILSIIRNGISLRGPNSGTVMVDKLHLIKLPTLLIHGAQDKVVPVKYARDACNLIPNARLKVIEECGHCPYIEKASEFNEAVIAFLGANEAGSLSV